MSLVVPNLILTLKSPLLSAPLFQSFVGVYRQKEYTTKLIYVPFFVRPFVKAS